MLHILFTNFWLSVILYNIKYKNISPPISVLRSCPKNFFFELQRKGNFKPFVAVAVPLQYQISDSTADTKR
jgi:hypothetical protein